MKTLLLLVIFLPFVLACYGQQKYSAEDNEMFIDFFTKAINKNPKDENAYLKRGICIRPGKVLTSRKFYGIGSSKKSGLV